MSAEFWAIIGVGVMVVAVGVTAITLVWNMYSKLDGRLASVEQRLSRLEGQIELLLQGLHIEVKARP